MRIFFLFLPLILFANDLIIKYLNLKPFYYQNQIVNLKIKIISPINNLNISNTNNVKLNIYNPNPYIYILDIKFKADNFPKYIFITSHKINKTIYLNKILNIKKLNKIKNFSNILANELNISEPIALKTKNNKILLSFTIKCKNCNLKDFNLTDNEKFTIINPNTATFLVTLPQNIKKFNFYYFNLKSQTFKKISIPVKIKDETISTQTNINPKENIFFTPLNILILILIALFLILFLIYQKIWILLFPLILSGYLIYQFIPKGEIYLHKGQKVTILPTPNSTVIYIIEKNQKAKIIARSRNYVEIKINNKIGWVNENN